MYIKRVCNYFGPNYNLLPAILVTPMNDGVIIAFKIWTLHLGIYLAKGVPAVDKDEHEDNPCG